MVGRFDGWTLLVVLAAGAAFAEIAAGEQVSITALTWGSESPNTLTLCANESLADGNIGLLVYGEDGAQTDYIASSFQETCATFDVPAPVSDQQNSFELLVVDGEGAILQQGVVIFTLMGEMIACGETQFARVTSGTVSNSTEDLACLPDSTVCYSGTPGDVCITDLDVETYPELVVCVPTTVFVDAIVAVPGSFVADTLRYMYEDSSASFSMSYETESTNPLAELLSRSRENLVLVASSCDSDLCQLESFTPSSAIYDLCGVFPNATTNLVTDVGLTTFQDLMLKVDTATVPENFYFIRPAGDGLFEVYHGNDSNSIFDITTPSTLDCSRLPTDSFCYGVVIEVSAFIAVSSTDKNNSIVAPAPTEQSFLRDTDADLRGKLATEVEMTRSMDRKTANVAGAQPVGVDLGTVGPLKAETVSRSLKKKFQTHDVQTPNIAKAISSEHRGKK